MFASAGVVGNIDSGGRLTYFLTFVTVILSKDGNSYE